MDTPRKIAVFLPNWVGDVVMATPALRALREHFPKSQLIGVMRPYVTEVLAGTHWLNTTVRYEKSIRSRWRAAGKLRAMGVDTAVLLTNSLSTALMARAAGASQRVGYSRHGRGWLLTKGLLPPREGGKWRPISAVDSYLNIAQAMGCPAGNRRVSLATLPEDEQQADAVWTAHGYRDEHRVVILSAGGAYGSAKHWPIEQCAELARRLASEDSLRVLVLCGPAEREAAESVVQMAGHEGVGSLAAAQLSLGLSKACVRRAALMISTDSGPRHFAAAFQTPCVSLFGSTDPRWADNHHPEEVQLSLGLDCSPCAKRVCPLKHHRCMRELSVAAVRAAALQLLAAADKRRAA